jgi:hypothetical protein
VEGSIKCWCLPGDSASSIFGLVSFFWAGSWDGSHS